ncbi:unnamed protein product [Rotaria socialis]|uniref:SPRY domain-containing protein n=1 Tax=Rotaria socialis TaxID=392032 RepID=A0A818I1I6_9BILA|nr:unnamed protein product [Rotaria socialis]
MITSMPPNTATRIGWAQLLAYLQTPIGTDKFGYSWRSRKGTIFHEACGLHYSNEGYHENDVLGFLIILPETTPPDPLVIFKNYIYFGERDDLRMGETNLKLTNGGKIIFYKNGVNQGVAFTNICEGNYCAAISIYYGATVSANFGPRFVHSPTDSPVPWKPLTESTAETYCTHALNDLLFHISHDETIQVQIEILEKMHREARHVAPMPKPLLSGFVTIPELFEHEESIALRSYLLLDGRDKLFIGQNSLLPTEGALIMANYRLIFKGRPINPANELDAMNQ